MQFPFLIWSVIFGLVWIIAFLFRKDLRKEMLYTSLILAPFGLVNFLFIPEYWDPVVLYKFFGLFDVESIMHMFFLGGLSAVMYEEIFGYYHTMKRAKSKLSCDCRERNSKNSIIVILVILTLFLFFIRYFTEFSVLRSSFIFTALFIGYILLTRIDLIKESALGGVSFMVFYILSLIFVDFVFGGAFVNQWNPAGSLFFFLGIPIEEYIYALAFGMLGSVLYEGMLYVKLGKKK